MENCHCASLSLSHTLLSRHHTNFFHASAVVFVCTWCFFRMLKCVYKMYVSLCNHELVHGKLSIEPVVCCRCVRLCVVEKLFTNKKSHVSYMLIIIAKTISTQFLFTRTQATVKTLKFFDNFPSRWEKEVNEKEKEKLIYGEKRIWKKNWMILKKYMKQINKRINCIKSTVCVRIAYCL